MGGEARLGQAVDLRRRRPARRAARREFARRIPGQAPHYRYLGLDLGFTYERGAFIAEPTPKPEASDPVGEYRPTTWPSARLPHFWVERDGVRISIHDALAPDAFTLLVHADGARGWYSAVAAVAQRSPMPVRCFTIGAEPRADLLDREGAWTSLSEIETTGAILVRPDGHVAWRVRSLPGEPGDELLRVMIELLRLSPDM